MMAIKWKTHHKRMGNKYINLVQITKKKKRKKKEKTKITQDL